MLRLWLDKSIRLDLQLLDVFGGLDEPDEVFVPVGQDDLEVVLLALEEVDFVVGRFLQHEVDAEEVGESSVELLVFDNGLEVVVSEEGHAAAQCRHQNQVEQLVRVDIGQEVLEYDQGVPV